MDYFQKKRVELCSEKLENLTKRPQQISKRLDFPLEMKFYGISTCTKSLLLVLPNFYVIIETIEVFCFIVAIRQSLFCADNHYAIRACQIF